MGVQILYFPYPGGKGPRKMSPNRGFIWGLCLALAHRWEPESLFVILTAYMDESGTHDTSIETVMGGVMATARQWQRFDVHFEQIKKEFGFTIFHTRQFKKGEGEFRGWDEPKCSALLSKFVEIGENFIMASVAISVNNEEYNTYYKRTPDVPRKLRIPSKYGMCFEHCLFHFMEEALARKFRGSYPKLYIVCESGAKSGDAVRIFSEYKKHLDKQGIPMLETITFADKDTTAPLALADFLAHIRWVYGEEGSSPPPSGGGRSKRGSVRTMGYKPGELAQLKIDKINEFIARQKNKKLSAP